VDVAFVCVKLYDTDWATALIVPYLSASGFIVTMQNGLIEERVAAFAGWARTVGCVGGGLHLAMRGPGHIHRNRQSGVSGRKVFHVGETHGRLTPRIGFVAEMLEHVDRAGVTTNLWGARWSKLTANCMTSALCGVSGMSTPKLFADAAGQKIMTHLAAQAVTVGLALGFAIDDVFGLAAERWIAAAEGKGDARSQAAEVFQTRFDELADDASSGMAQDFARKRRSEIDYMNGYVANKAAEVGLCVPLHSAMTKLVKKIEAGLASPGPQSLEDLLNATTGD
ncbi:MAG: ketopantoate reductase C-terminal domain-containing protein, partial [Casimicrobiaceae bacterium]